ncbi:adenylate-forming reductase 03009-like [Pistacia vera]|uniref:adenylate-forming reductase 03009-like n=1 Tax=Pistacia vera TaxID=55513 RepID=UPI0012636EB9|nr:adenylate-forming reductase 03009-like [Pistacia vera]
MQNQVRFSSCRGVAFEIKPHADPFAITTAAEPNSSKRFWPSWNIYGNSSIVFPSSIQKSMSRASSHFCDLDLDVEDGDSDDESDITLKNLEKGKNEERDHHKPIIPSATKREQPSKAARKQESRLSVILLDQGLFTVYKRLFAVCLILNITGLVLAITGHFPYARNRASLFSILNILALTLCRSEAFLRIVFWLAVKTLGRSWVPLPIKTATTSLLQSLGGIHSGCGVSSVFWLIYALILTLKDRENTSPEIIGVASAILSLLCLSSLAAFPLFRHLHHNVFERIHRFAGWTALGLLWAFVILTISYDPKIKSYTSELGSRLIKQQEFWFTAAITVLIIIPWLTVRRVPVKVSAPSGAAGDFTKSLLSNPPSHLWVRQVHFAGLPYLTNMYDRVLLVATGSGICVFLSFLLQPCRASVSLVWVTKGIEQNFGKEITQMVSRHPKDKVIVHDTALFGRPNVSQMSVDAAKRWGAEVVIVTSNPEGSRDVVNACKSAGIPAFGPIWDS